MEKEQMIQLVKEAQTGQEKALNALFEAYYNNIYYFAFKTVKDSDLACDITQESFITIYKNIGSLNEPAAFTGWARQITYRHCLQYFKQKKDVLVEEDEDGHSIFDTVEETNTEFIPDETLEQDEFKKTILGIIDELTEEQRSAVMMYYFDELSVKEIAEIQGVSDGTVKSRLNYGRKAIKNSVEEYEKKHGVKLHSVGILPLLYWLFAQDQVANPMPKAAVGVAANSLAGATVVSGASAITTATTAATATGLGAKIIALPFAIKAAACVAAVALTVGGVAIGSSLMDKQEVAQEEKQEGEGQQDDQGESDQEELADDTQKQEEGQQGEQADPEEEDIKEDDKVDKEEDTKTETTVLLSEAEKEKLNQRFQEYFWILCWQEFETAADVDLQKLLELWPYEAGTMTVCGVELPVYATEAVSEYGTSYEIYHIKKADIDRFTTALLGRTYDCTGVSGEREMGEVFYYDAASDSMVYDKKDVGEYGGSGEEDEPYWQYGGFTTTDNKNFTVTYKEYVLNLETYEDEETGRTGEMKIQLVDGNYIVISNQVGQ